MMEAWLSSSETIRAPGAERGKHPQVGLEAGREDQGRLAVPPGGDVVLEGRVDGPVADDQPG